MADSDNQNADQQELQAEVERLRREVERLGSQDVSQELKLSEAKYRALVEGSSDLIYVLDKDGCFTFANRELENLLGYTPEEIIGRHFSEVLHPEDVRSLRYAFHERRTGERATRRLEVRLRSKAGDTRDVELDIGHFSLSASGIYHDQIFLGTHGVAHDITERKYQETKHLALQQVRKDVWNIVREDDIQQILESIKISLKAMDIPFHKFGVHILDMDEPPMLSFYCPNVSGSISKQGEWMITDTEDFANSIVEVWRRGKLVHFRDLSDDGTDRDRERIAELYGEVHSLIDAPFSHGVLTVTSCGQAAFSSRNLIFVHELAEVLSDGLRRLEDLRELALSEKRYRTLVETPNLVVMLLDTEGNFLYVSPQIEQWLGYQPRDIYSDPDILMRIVHADDQKAMEAFLQLGEVPVLRDLEFRWRTRDGEHLWAAGSLFPIYESAEDEQINRVSMAQVVVQDITERKRIEALVQDSLKEKEVLLKEIHHRVKNNLQIISSLLHLQSRELKDSASQEIFSDSQHRIASMALIHEELYNSADLGRIDFADYARSLVENLFESYGINIDRIVLKVEVDASPLNLDRAIPLGLIINELVSNSLKYAFPDGRKGQITIGLWTETDDRFALTVSDDGVGLPEDIDFRRSQSLGLKLVATLANQLKSDFELDRSRGTTFTITRS